MNLTAEISMYPMRENYLPPIDSFIAALNVPPGLHVETSATATIVIGDYDEVMTLLRDAIAASYREFGTSVFVTKLIPGYDPRESDA